MPRTVTVGLDGTPESRAAAAWAAREARLRGLPLRILNVWEPAPEPLAEARLPGAETRQHGTGRTPREAAETVRLRHPDVEVVTAQLDGNPADVLTEEARTAELLVLGSRGLGGINGFVIGSVGLSVIAHATRPVVLVRAGEQAADEHRPGPAGAASAATPFRPVVLGLDTADPAAELLEFAFDAATRRHTALRVVHGWNLPASAVYAATTGRDLSENCARGEAAALAEALRPWREKYPDVDVTEECRNGGAAAVLVPAAQDASLAVVGRRIRTSPLGAHIGHVTHAALHHITAPVAVVAHG
ncbi:universal stress protein [Streptomyces sp. NPDC001606]